MGGEGGGYHPCQEREGSGAKQRLLAAAWAWPPCSDTRRARFEEAPLQWHGGFKRGRSSVIQRSHGANVRDGSDSDDRGFVRWPRTGRWGRGGTRCSRRAPSSPAGQTWGRRQGGGVAGRQDFESGREVKCKVQGIAQEDVLRRGGKGVRDIGQRDKGGAQAWQ